MNKDNLNNKNSIFNKFPLNICKYFIYGIFVILIIIGKLLQYLIYGFSLPLIIFNVINRISKRNKGLDSNESQRLLKKEEEKFHKKIIFQNVEKINSSNLIQNNRINEDILLKAAMGNNEKKNEQITNILEIEKAKEEYIKNESNNSKKNKKSKTDDLLAGINFGNLNYSNRVKSMYQYIAKNSDGKTVKGYIEAYSKPEVMSYLISEGFEVYSVKTSKSIQFFHGATSSYSKSKMANKDLIFFLTQLSTYIKSGIPLVESLKILSKQYQKIKYQKLFKSLIYELSTGESFSSALDKQGSAFPKILVNMIKASEMTGELPETLDDMADYFTNIEKTRKQMVTAMMYPSIILVFAIAVISFILIWVIPKFVEIYESMDANIPAFTQFILNLSEFFQKNIYIMLAVFIVLILVVKYLYDNVKAVRFGLQWFAMHVPVFSNVIIYNEVTVFTKTFSSLLAHNVFITDSMEILNQVTTNEVYRSIIKETIVNLAKGDRISKSFEGHWAFPIPAYEMLVTGEKTGQLPEMMKKVSDYYQELHANSVSRIKTFMEPVLIVFLTVVVGAIVLAILIPMFGMYSAIQDLS